MIGSSKKNAVGYSFSLLKDVCEQSSTICSLQEKTYSKQKIQSIF